MRGSRDDLPTTFQAGAAYTRETEWGDMNVLFEANPGGSDATELLKAFPDGRCPCPHWGYVLKGRIRVKYADHDEILNPGDAYYMAPGHIPITEEDSEIVEFSPRVEYQQRLAVLAPKYKEMERSSG
jgi:hypothetical protein